MNKREKQQPPGVSQLSTILPREQLIGRFGSALILEEFGKADLKTIAKKHPSAVLQIGGSIWNRIVQKKWHPLNPLHFAHYFQKSDPNLYQAISTLLGVDVIRDIYYVKAWTSKKKKSNLIVELVAAWVFRNDLLLADVTFRDPERPIPTEQRSFALQTHKGLGLLPTLLGNMQHNAKELGCEQLTLTAAMRDLVDLFVEMTR
jgi:hypothetical protein